MFKRIQDAINRRLNPKIRQEEEFKNRLKWISFQIVQEDEKFIVVGNKDYQKIWLRKGSSDLHVFEQAFLQEDFLPLELSVKDNKIDAKTIIDAGANCGLTTILFLHAFPNATVIAVEPDPDNFEVLVKNTAPYKERAQCLQKAIWKTNENIQLTSDWGDGQAWAKAVKPIQDNEAETVSGITIDDLLDSYNIKTCELIKMDIEGTEELLFSDEKPPSFLDRVECLAVEIHGHLNCRERIISQLNQKRFFIVQSGTATIALKSTLQ